MRYNGHAVEVAAQFCGRLIVESPHLIPCFSIVTLLRDDGRLNPPRPAHPRPTDGRCSPRAASSPGRPLGDHTGPTGPVEAPTCRMFAETLVNATGAE